MWSAGNQAAHVRTTMLARDFWVRRKVLVSLLVPRPVGTRQIRRCDLDLAIQVEQ
jgi:hypothetical protein